MQEVNICDNFCNPSSELRSQFKSFIDDMGESYQSNRGINFSELRHQEYARLDENNHLYLDYVGGSLHAKTHVADHAKVLNEEVLGNPHSSNPASVSSSLREEACRARILSHFNADPAEYEVIYTLNASHAVKLVGESFPFRWGSRYLYVADSHNCVVGLRRFAQAQRSKVICLPVSIPDLRVDSDQLLKELAKGGQRTPKLFALTGQSNTTGVRHSLDSIQIAQSKGWTVLLDAAALAPTSTVDLGAYPADFVAISFYKMFGYPTGIGCLIARRSALKQLERPWFSGGTVRLVSAFHKNIHFMNDRSSGDHFQDGTIPFGALPAVELGLNHLGKIGLSALNRRVSTLTQWLLKELKALTHENGSPLVRTYGPSCMENRGGTIAMNLYDENGRWIPHRIVESLAAKQNISIRTGCFCNPGIAEQVLNYSKFSENPPQKMGATYLWLANKIGVDRLLSQIEPFEKPFGMVRISVGIASNFEDVWRWVQFLKLFLDPEFVKISTDHYEENFEPPTTLC